MRRPDSIKLSSRTTVAEYQTLENERKRDEIRGFLEQRFKERYLNPMSSFTSCESGFSAMALACLFIEAIETFRLGFEHSNRKSKTMFTSFFNRHKELFPHLDPADFYKNIRCGILHQAEITKGWRLSFTEKEDFPNRVINIPNFIENARQAFENYLEELKSEEGWNGPIWCNLRTKMGAICRNCSS